MEIYNSRGMKFTPDKEEDDEDVKKKALEGVVMLYAPSPEKKDDKEGCMPGESEAECNDRKKPKRGQ